MSLKRLFLLGCMGGLLVVGSATIFWPFPAPLRYPSLITVPPDGGRQEEFSMRWPEDRLTGVRPGTLLAWRCWRTGWAVGSAQNFFGSGTGRIG